MPRAHFNDLGGGLNQGRPPSEIQDNEALSLKNFYPFSTKLKRRGGTRLLNSGGAYAEQLTGVFPYRPSVLGTVTTILGSLTTLAKLDGVDIVEIPAQVDFSIGSSTERWTFFEYKDILYAFRRNSNQLIRCDGTYYGPAGISAPTTAPTLAEGAAGDIPAADFYGVFTYYNTATNVESNPSTASAVYAHAGAKKINWSGITISSNQQVNARRLYRTLPDNTGVYFFMDQIDNNFDTTYIGDNVLVQDLDRSVSFFNDVPPTGLLYGDVWKERLFATDGDLVWYSESGLVECFDEDNYIPVFPDDGHVIRAIHAFGDRLVIGKTNKVHYLVGTDPAYFQLLTLSDRHGCVAHHTMQSAEGLLFWLGLDNVYRSDGNSVKGIASVKLESVFESSTADQLEEAFAWVYPRLNWYILVIPGVGEFIYNYKTDAWSEVETECGISAGALHYDDDYEPESFICDDSGNLFRFNDTSYNYDDADGSLGNAITAEYISKEMNAGDPGSKAVMLRVALLSDQYNENITLTWQDFEGTTVNERTVSLNYDEPWKVYALSTRRQAKSHTRLKVSYSGATAIELQGYAVDMEALGRFATRAH